MYDRFTPNENAADTSTGSLDVCLAPLDLSFSSILAPSRLLDNSDTTNDEESIDEGNRLEPKDL